jgi:hypothetical protein
MDGISLDNIKLVLLLVIKKLNKFNILLYQVSI